MSSKTVSPIDMAEAPWGTGKPVTLEVPRAGEIVCAAAIAGKPRLWVEWQLDEQEVDVVELWLVEDGQPLPPCATYKTSLYFKMRMYHVFENGRDQQDDE